MNPFRHRGTERADSIQKEAPGDVVSRLDTALTAIFSEGGKRTVLYYMTSKYGLSLEQASLDPSKLERALTNLLGEIGWMVVKQAILEQFWERKIGVEEASMVKRVSLREAFGLTQGFGLGLFYKPF